MIKFYGAGEVIERIRLNKGLTLEEMSTKIGIELTLLWRMEKNQRGINSCLINKISKELDIPNLMILIFEKCKN